MLVIANNSGQVLVRSPSNQTQYSLQVNTRSSFVGHLRWEIESGAGMSMEVLNHTILCPSICHSHWSRKGRWMIWTRLLISSHNSFHPIRLEVMIFHQGYSGNIFQCFNYSCQAFYRKNSINPNQNLSDEDNNVCESKSQCNFQIEIIMERLECTKPWEYSAKLHLWNVMNNALFTYFSFNIVVWPADH